MQSQTIVKPADRPRSPAAMCGHAIFAILVPVPVACFAGTLVTDLVYAKTATMQWANMSVWLLTIGLIVSIFVVIAGLVEFFADPRLRVLPAIWIYGLANGLALVLSIFNVLVHSRDAYTSVVPTGLALSAIVVLILAATSILGWSAARHHRIGAGWDRRP